MTMRDSIMANIGVLVCFQVNAVDAVRLLPELRSEYLTEADITGLPQYNAYVKIGASGEVLPPFTMQVLPPFREDDVGERLVYEGSFEYSRDGAIVDAELAGPGGAAPEELPGSNQGGGAGPDRWIARKAAGAEMGQSGVPPAFLLEDLGKAGQKRRRRRKRKRKDKEEDNGG